MLRRRHALHCGRAPSRHTGAVAARRPRGRRCARRGRASEPLLSVLWGRLLDRVAVSSLGPGRAGPSVRPARRPQPGAGVRRRRGLARPPCSIPRELGRAVPELCKDLGKRFSVRILCHDVKDKLWVPSWGHRVRMPASILPSAWLARPASAGGLGGQRRRHRSGRTRRPRASVLGNAVSSPPAAPCTGGTFFCHSSMCINNSLVCNGVQNCAYPWDENHCRGESPRQRPGRARADNGLPPARASAAVRPAWRHVTGTFPSLDPRPLDVAKAKENRSSAGVFLNCFYLKWFRSLL